MSRSRRDRYAEEQLKEEGFSMTELKNIEFDADGKPCKACTSAKTSMNGPILGLTHAISNEFTEQRKDCAPDVNEIGNGSWVRTNTVVFVYKDKTAKF
jgi:hypothetical protein